MEVVKKENKNVVVLDREGYEALQTFVKEYEEGKIIHAIIVFDTTEDTNCFLPITTTSYEHLFWMMRKVSRALEDEEEEEEEY